MAVARNIGSYFALRKPIIAINSNPSTIQTQKIRRRGDVPATEEGTGQRLLTPTENRASIAGRFQVIVATLRVVK